MALSAADQAWPFIREFTLFTVGAFITKPLVARFHKRQQLDGKLRFGCRIGTGRVQIRVVAARTRGEWFGQVLGILQFRA